MKKLITFIIALLFTVNLNFGQRSTREYRTLSDTNTIRIQFQDKVRVTRQDQRTYDELLSYIASQHDVDQATIETLGVIIQSIPELVAALTDRPKAYYSREDYLKREWAISSMDLLGMIEKENRMYAIGDLWTFFIAISGLSLIFVQLYRRTDWRALLISATCVTLVTYIIWQVLPVVLSQLFNSEYNVIKALL